MAKKASAKSGGDGAKKKSARKTAAKSTTPKNPVKAKQESGSKQDRAERPESEDSMADAFFRLLESPLVVDLIAVAATAALAALAERRFSRRDEGSRKGASRTAKAAGKAAAAAVGRRLAEEWDEIRKASEAKAREQA